MNAWDQDRYSLARDLTFDTSGMNDIMSKQKELAIPVQDTASKGGFGSSLGTPEMMAIGTGLQVLGQYLDAPYKEMAAKQAMEMNRRDKQDAALANLQNISSMYGRL